METAKRLYKSRKVKPPEPHKIPIRVVCVSDTHNNQLDLPDGDLLIHAGDLSKNGTLEEIQAQLDWLKAQKHQHKVVIGGNHDRLLDPTFPERHPGILPLDTQFSNLNFGSLTYLSNTSATLKFENGRDVKVYGSPFVPECGKWAFMYPPGKDFWHGLIPVDADIVVSHGPPKWHLDLTGGGFENHGCPDLLKELKRVQPPLVIRGHIHEAHGEEDLLFDEVQSLYERIMETGGTSRRMMLTLALKIYLWNLSKKGKRSTHLVNAAVVEGGRAIAERALAYEPVVCLI